MANRIKYIHNLIEENNSLDWSSRYPLAVDGINVDLFNGLNLEEELKIGGGNHTVNISEQEADPTGIFSINNYAGTSLANKNISLESNEKTVINEKYIYDDKDDEDNNIQRVFESLVVIDESSVDITIDEVKYNVLTTIRVQLTMTNVGDRSTIKKIIIILENDFTTKIEEVIVS